MDKLVLARAISELDDDLLEEARQPFSQRKHALVVLYRYTVVAACLALILMGAFWPRHGGNDFIVSINGTCLMADHASEQSVEIPLTMALQLRNVNATEIPVQLSTGADQAIVTAGAGGSILYQERVCTEVTVTEDCTLVWLVDVPTADTFLLTVCMDGKTVTLTARVQADTNSLLVTASHS